MAQSIAELHGQLRAVQTPKQVALIPATASAPFVEDAEAALLDGGAGDGAGEGDTASTVSSAASVPRTCMCCVRSSLGWSGGVVASFHMATLLTVLAATLSLIAACGSGDIFWAGWATGASSKTANKGTLFRLTLHMETQCDGDAGDTFCTEFFAAAPIPISSLPGGAALEGVNAVVQGAFGGSLVCAVVSIVRLLLTWCAARAVAARAAKAAAAASSSASAVGVESALAAAAASLRLQHAEFHGFAALSAAQSAAGAALCGVGAWQYAVPAAAFMAAQDPPVQGWAFMGGYSCGLAAGAFHALCALQYAWVVLSLWRAPPDFAEAAPAVVARGAAGVGGTGGGGGLVAGVLGVVALRTSADSRSRRRRRRGGRSGNSDGEDDDARLQEVAADVNSRLFRLDSSPSDCGGVGGSGPAGAATTSSSTTRRNSDDPTFVSAAAAHAVPLLLEKGVQQRGAGSGSSPPGGRGGRQHNARR